MKSTALIPLFSTSLLAVSACATDPGAEPPPSATEVAVAFSQNAGAAMALAFPLIGNQFADGALIPNGTYAKDSGCVTAVWQGTTHVTFTFNHCVLPDTGLPLDGVLDISISENPHTFKLDYTKLLIGTVQFDGTESLAVGNHSVAVDASITRTANGATRTTSIDSTLSKTATAFVLDGMSSVTGGTDMFSIASKTVTWGFGQCLPSAGSLTYNQSGSPIAITFLSTTPVDGFVQVERGGQTFLVHVPCL